MPHLGKGYGKAIILILRKKFNVGESWISNYIFKEGFLMKFHQVKLSYFKIG